MDETQTAALAYIIPWLLERAANGKRTAAELAALAEEKIRKDGLLSMVPRKLRSRRPGGSARPGDSGLSAEVPDDLTYLMIFTGILSVFHRKTDFTGEKNCPILLKIQSGSSAAGG